MSMHWWTPSIAGSGNINSQMTSTSTAPVAPPKPIEPTHPCVRCGRPVPLDIAMCEFCNPLGLSQPASSQVHGTVFVAVALAVVGLALLGRLALSGVGPFRAEVASVSAAPTGLLVTLNIHNEGSKAGATSCRITDAARADSGPSAVIQTPRVDAGQTRQFSTTLREFGQTPRPLAIQCDAF
jgi:hypothetical protein